MKIAVKLFLLAVLVFTLAYFILSKKPAPEKYEPRESAIETEITPEVSPLPVLPKDEIIKPPVKETPVVTLQDNAGAKWIKILNYHEIFPESVRSSKDPKINRFSKPSDLLLIVTAENFERQMKFLAENFKCVKMSELGAHLENKQPFEKNVVVITFDGADESICQYAYPILKKYNLPATLFLHINSVKLDRTAMKWDTLKKIHEEGLMEIESHSMSHPHLNKLKTGETEEEYENRVRWEMTESKKIIEEKLNKKVYYFAYPYGSYNSTVMRLLKECGYKASVTVQWDKNTVETNPYALRRRGVFGNISLAQFIELVTKNQKDDMREFAD